MLRFGPLEILLGFHSGRWRRLQATAVAWPIWLQFFKRKCLVFAENRSSKNSLVPCFRPRK
jgi:hypothetical protein